MTPAPTIGEFMREVRPILGALQAIRPKVFDARRPKPLAIGVHEQIAAELLKIVQYLWQDCDDQYDDATQSRIDAVIAKHRTGGD